MFDKIIAIKINADGTAAVQTFNNVSSAGRKMGDDISQSANSLMSKIKNNFAGIVGFAGAITAAAYTAKTVWDAVIVSVANKGEELNKMSQQIGISVEKLSGLQYAAELSETNLETLNKSVGIFSKSLHGMNEEGKDTSQYLKALGVTSSDSYTALLQLSDAFSKMEDGSGKTAVALALLGRGGKEMIPMLNEGSEGIKRMYEEAEKAGIVFSAEMAKASDEFNDNLTRLKANAESLAVSIGGSLIPILNKLMEHFLAAANSATRMYERIADLDQEIAGMQGVRKWMKEHGLGFLVQEDNKLLDARIKERQGLLDKLWDIQTPKGEKVAKTKAPTLPNDDIKKVQKFNDEYDKLRTNLERNIELKAEEWLAEKIKVVTLGEYDYRRQKLYEEYAERAKVMGMTETLYETFRAELKKLDDEETREKLESLADFYSKVDPYGQKYFDLEMKMIDLKQQAYADFYKDDVAAAQWAAKEKMKYSSEVFYRENEDRQQAFAGMASSLNQMAQLYEEDSKARQALSAASKVATMAEIALQVQKNIMIAIGAVVNQGTGEPYSAFARIAAMIAVVAGVLSIGGIAFSMGAGGGGGGKSAPVLPASTVLGAEAGTGSDSVAKSLKLLEDTYKMEYRELKELNDSMKDLNRNITGLVTSIVRTGGVTAGTFNVPGNKQSPAETAWLKFNDFVGQFIPDLPMLGDFSKKIFNWFEGLVGDILSGIFGGEKSVKVKAAGIKLGEITINDLLAGVDIAGQQYADIKEKISGGIFGSDKTKYYTLYKALDEDINALFTSVFSDMSRTLVALAGSFGADVEETLAYMFPEVKINLKGMNAEEINKAISEAISKAGDIAVEALFGAIVKGYQQVGEGLLETAIRLAQDKAVITEMLAMTNQSFTGTVPEVIAFSEALIEMSGGLDKLTSAAQKYYDSFFSDAEQQARTYKQMTDILADMNMTLPATRDGFRDLVESLDLTTTSGQEAYITLMQLSESAAAYYDYLAELQKKAFDFVFDLQTKIDSLTGSSRAIGMMWGRMTEIYYQINTAAGSAADRLEALKEGIALLDQWVAANIAAIEDFYRIRKEAIQMQIENINKQIERLNEQKTVISEQISAIQKQIDLTKTWKSVLESVEKQILDMKTSTDSPKDIFERMDVMKSEMERVRDLYEGATGEEKAGYAADLQRLIQEYLGMAQEAYQRPSPEYQQIYDEMLRWLEGIRTDAVAGSASETDLLAQIIDLEEQSKAIDEQIKVYQEQIKDLNVQMAALDTQMAADIQAFKEEAAGYYQWAMEEGAKLYDDQLSELGLLLESNEEGNQILIHIHDVLNGISKGLGIPVPALAEGGYVTKPTLALLGEAGPEAVIPLSKMGSGQQYHTMSINISLPPITINAGEKTSPQGTARATEDIIVRSLKSGRIRKVVQEVFAGR